VNVAVGLIEGQSEVNVQLAGSTYIDTRGEQYKPGRYRFAAEATLIPTDAEMCTFAIDNVTIGIGFHWERQESQVYRGALRLVRRAAGLTVINDVSLEDYVTSVISSEMSPSCPLELLKAHAVISRSWLRFPKENPARVKRSQSRDLDSREILRWYGREAHLEFEVCADDHCQRYQGITKAWSPAAAEAVRATGSEFLRYNGATCDARFSKSCGGITERYATAWDDQEIPYLESVYDGSMQAGTHNSETWIRTNPPAYCNTTDSELLARILPGLDQETQDFYRWRVTYAPDELAALIEARIAVGLGPIRELKALDRGPSGRIYRLKIIGERGHVILGKELEIRRALSSTHLYSSAFVVDHDKGRLVLRGAGWGHGVGLCQIGAAVMASEGKTYKEILQHYYRGTTVSV
jgi:SpoIID/LytB domain protein